MFSTLQQVEGFFKQRKQLGMKPGLERIHALLKRLGNPEKDIKAVHIAGTNGKGSTLHFLKAALQANDYSVGVFTSPSFHGLCGHILLNDEAIPADLAIGLLNEALPHIQEMDDMDSAPTEFEILTALAFCYFADHGEIVLIEAGMGGRFDTTNSFQPILSIITNIALDHTDYLGHSVEEIAYHKAGIIKQGAPVIIGQMEERALAVILKEAAEQEASSYIFGKDFNYQYDGDEQVRWKSGPHEHMVQLDMKGEHQLKNVSLALKALEELEKCGYEINWKKAVTRMGKTILPGRFELVHISPTVIIDAAHNPDGVNAFIRTVTQFYPVEKKHVIVAMFQDKDTDEVLRLIHKHFDEITLTSFDHPRAWKLQGLETEKYVKIREVNPDFRQVLEHSLRDDEIHFITGSLHFITEVRNYFLREM